VKTQERLTVVYSDGTLTITRDGRTETLTRADLDRTSLDAIGSFVQDASKITSIADLEIGEEVVVLEDIMLLENGLPTRLVRGQIITNREMIRLALERGTRLARKNVVNEAELAQRSIVERAMGTGYAVAAKARLHLSQLGTR
jgi:hypothetical protein